MQLPRTPTINGLAFGNSYDSPLFSSTNYRHRPGLPLDPLPVRYTGTAKDAFVKALVVVWYFLFSFSGVLG